MAQTDGTTQRIAHLSGVGSEAIRWRSRQAAHRIAADCERLLDELLQTRHTALRDALSNGLVAARNLAAMLAHMEGGAPLFDSAMRPSARLAEAHRRLCEALAFAAPAIPATPREELAIATLAEMYQSAMTMFEMKALVGPVVDDKPAAKARILIVDDEPLMIALLQRNVNGMGHETVAASNGVEALAKIAEQDFDLVLTDIEMPNMSGIELLTAIKGRESSRHIPVVVISGADDMAHVTQCIVAGAEDHISKPFQPELLRARVTASIDRKRFADRDTAQRAAVAKLIEAAEAVEGGGYSSDRVAAVADRTDGVGRLARVFDRMVMGLKLREDRLRERLRHLQHDVVSSSGSHSAMSGYVSEESPFAVGDVISDRYVITAQLGQGGMGAVYQARDAELGEDVAIKTVRLDLLKTDSGITARLKSEILLTRKISHPNVVRAHDFGQANGHSYITMELVKGITVADLLDQRGRLTVESTLAIATQLCDALAVAHAAGIIHRDIKPANLLVDESGQLKVMDFGIARSFVDGFDASHTMQGHVVGTPRYMAPELLMGQKATVQSDLYAVGAVLYECLTGHVPFWAESPKDLVGEVFNGSLQPLELSIPNIPPELARLVHAQLSFEPNRRASSARELGHKLAEVEHRTEPGRAQR